MPDPRGSLTCPTCDTAMNHHANKLVSPRAPDEAAATEPGLDGVLVEAHCCPDCGETATRSGSFEL